MIELAKEIKAKLEQQENFDLVWDLDDYMDLISTLADRKDYYVKLNFIAEDPEKRDKFKVWEIKNMSYFGDIIDQDERK